ncbi:MAG: hypothetical protein JXB19_07070 [Bacteroidales bacterium]|nr:hypothetical protein [Bacteroidales bacterium]
MAMKIMCIIIAAAGVSLLLLGVMAGKQNDPYTSLQEQAFTYPENIKAIIDNKCYVCHSLKGESEDARDVLMWDDLPGLSKARQIASLDAVIEVLDNGMMPPQMVVKDNPDAQLTDEERSLLRDWAETAADNLLK